MKWTREWVWRLLLTMLLVGHAVGMKISHAAEWTPADTKRELVWQGLWALDWGQTRYIAEHPDKFFERNAILGKHPSVGRVNTYFVLTGALHYWLMRKAEPGTRKMLQWVTIGIGASNVANNYHMGVRVGF